MAKGYLLFVLAALWLPFLLFPQGNEPPPVVQYQINAELLPDAGEVLGSETLIWRNPAPVAVDELRFHLYYNAFRNERSTFMTEGGERWLPPARLHELRFGEIRITAMRVAGGEDLTGKIVYLAPDDGNGEDRTVMAVHLANRVEPGASVTLEIGFTLQVPQIFSRTGREKEYFFFGQWFPKIGVLQPDGTWHCHQFHAHSEFFSDYGDYRVTLTVPGRFVVGASGSLVKRNFGAGGVKTVVFSQKGIHDFAWTAYPLFQRIVESVRLRGNTRETEIILLLSPGHENARERYLRSVKYALTFLACRLFPYPYRTITIVDPPLDGMGSAGMEYPTLITGGFFPLFSRELKFVELVTIHEFLHQYWYGMIGSDEFREAWLDEGVNTFFEMEMLDDYLQSRGESIDLGLMKAMDWEFQRLRSAGLLPLNPVNSYSWKFVDFRNYSASVYARAGIFLRSLKNYVGARKMTDFFRFYGLKYRFRHPRTEDFIRTFDEFMGEDFGWAFDQFINGEANLDQAVYSIASVKISDRPETYRNEVIFIRREGFFPVDLLIRLKNGCEIRHLWKERERWRKIVSFDPSPVRLAAVDPEFKVPLDRNLLNNSRTIDGGQPAIRRLSAVLTFFFQNLLGFLPL
jgi:hypothetical protein